MTAQSENGQHRIVVSADGPVPSKAALAWALRRVRDATCPVVMIRDSVTGRPAEPERG